MKNFVKYWLPVVLMAGLIFIGSSISELPSVEIPHEDKVAHLIEYALLGFFLKRGLSQGKPDRTIRSSLWAVTGAVFYGITDELHQYLIPSREMSAFDLLFDGLGAILGQIFYSRISPRI